MDIVQKSFEDEKIMPLSFVERLRISDHSATHLIKTYNENDEPCWFLLNANEKGIKALECTSSDEIINLHKFGKIVACGWGHEISMKNSELH